MHKILSQLLLLTRGYEGRYHLEREVFPLRAVVASVMEELAETAAASRIRLFNQVPEEVSLYADQSLTTQLLINLIGNSIRYGREQNEVVVQSDPNPVHLHRLRRRNWHPGRSAAPHL